MMHYLLSVVAMLTALVLCVPLQAQTPVNDYLRARAEQRELWAQLSLGFMYANGNGVPQDHLQAYVWYNLAASELTDTEARDFAIEPRDRIAAQLTRADISEARRISRE